MRSKYSRCPKCHLGGFEQRIADGDGRPEFVCTRCRYIWTCGSDGGEYAHHSIHEPLMRHIKLCKECQEAFGVPKEEQ